MLSRHQDPIVAIATAPGRGAVGIVRVSGRGLDRLVHGHVVDFLDFVFWGWHYWTFNLADSAITCGAILLGWTLLRPVRAAAPEAAAE